MGAPLDDDMAEVMEEFLVESNESLDALDHAFVTLEQDPTDDQTLAAVFRTMHSIKGTSGFLGFGRLESLTHAAESLLSLLRDGQMTLTPEVTTALLATSDAVRAMLGHIERDATDGDDDHAVLVAELAALQHSSVGVPEPEPVVEVAEEVVPLPIGELFVEAGLISPEELDSALAEQKAGDPRHLGEILVERGVLAPTDVVEALNTQQEVRGGAAREASTIRVEVGLLDKIMNLVGELVLIRNQVLQHTMRQVDVTFLPTAQRLNTITSELQEGVMKTRMQPIGSVWSKFPRVVRDLSLSCAKQVRLEMEGRETELDKTVIEAIKDPLTHLVRNAVDHGIEAPAVRVAAGKPAEGRLSLRAFHEGGFVNIEIGDDGGGIDTVRVRAKAVAKGLIRTEVADRMSDREAAGLIFVAGLSTADQVSNVSGRGVGMDVVKTNIERIGGAVEVASEIGKGTTVRVKIPLTLAIIPALMVSAAGERYAIPQASLVELLRVDSSGPGAGIEYVQGAPVHRRRGRLLPLVSLAGELGLAPPSEGPAGHDGPVNIVVLQSDTQQFGLVVDTVNDTEEIVVKPLGRMLKGVGAFAGATIMGDGLVALILDIAGLADQAGVTSAEGRSGSADATDTAGTIANRGEPLLILGVGTHRRVALPLSDVARLEEVDRADVEWAGTTEVVQYRGQVMPLIRVGDVVGATPRPGAEDFPLQVVVHGDGGRAVGLVVDEILDIAEDVFTIHPAGASYVVKGTAVIQGKVTELLDLTRLIATIHETEGAAV